MVSGATVAIRKKFSASNFWKDCIRYDVTAFSYVGEICRYLAAQPPSPLDKQHKVRVCFDTGVRPNIWKDFSERFHIKVCEIYAATEGNVVLINIDAHLGACGFIPYVNKLLKTLPYHIIKVDKNFNPVRNGRGFCIECEPNEKGLIVGEVIDSSSRSEFSGYANSDDATNKKIIRDLFKKGQHAFNTGDLLVKDDFGWVYFVDRVGDTFRWKSENVSTIEVENVVSARVNHAEVAVYGVTVPNQEGRAGMAVIMLLDVDMRKLGEELKSDLPSYAKPMFIRLTTDVDHTETLKAQKTRLQEEAFNVNIIKDKVYYFDSKEQNYLPLTIDVYKQIQDGTIKF